MAWVVVREEARRVSPKCIPPNSNGLVTKEWFQVGSTNAYTGGRHVCAGDEGQGPEAILAVSLRSVKGWWAYVVKTELCHHPNL